MDLDDCRVSEGIVSTGEAQALQSSQQAGKGFGSREGSWKELGGLWSSLLTLATSR